MMVRGEVMRRANFPLHWRPSIGGWYKVAQRRRGAFDIPLRVIETDSALTLSILSDPPEDSADASPTERVRQILTQQDQPISLQRLRQLCGMRTATVCAALAQLAQQGLVSRHAKGYQLKPP